LILDLSGKTFFLAVSARYYPHGIAHIFKLSPSGRNGRNRQFAAALEDGRRKKDKSFVFRRRDPSRKTGKSSLSLSLPLSLSISLISSPMA
jgi:hypothetical protein